MPGTVWVVALEPIESRYTCEWLHSVPEELAAAGLEPRTILGHLEKDEPSPGAFLNFLNTNIWKSEQVISLARLFKDGKVNGGDNFLYTDFWNPTVFMLRYMAALQDIPISIHGIAHAGHYDPHDFLARAFLNTPWISDFERALFRAYSCVYVATEFHRDLIADSLFSGTPPSNLYLSGQPHSTMAASLLSFSPVPQKEDAMIFTTRHTPEKQPRIFTDLARRLNLKAYIPVTKNLTKSQYHELLYRSKIVFSAALQETLGIGCMEGVLAGCIPVVPDRLSYSEMYSPEFKYPSAWTESWGAYLQHADELAAFISDLLTYPPDLEAQRVKLTKFLSAERMVQQIARL